MTLTRFFSHSAEKAFARDLVLRLVKDLPPTLMEKRRNVLSVNKITRLLERTYQSVQDYQREHKLGFVKRALLANSFKWELKNNHYPEDFVDIATEGLVVALAKKDKSPPTKT